MILNKNPTRQRIENADGYPGTLLFHNIKRGIRLNASFFLYTYKVENPVADLSGGDFILLKKIPVFVKLTIVR
mgnify:CR=1 FL=1